MYKPITLIVKITLVAALATTALGGGGTADPCKGSSTRDLELCASERRLEARKAMDQYLQEIDHHIGSDETDATALARSQE